jgi:molecular chaperone DnaK (HSP70)
MGRLAIDFGTSNTVIGVWDEARKDGVPLRISDLSRSLPSGAESVPVIPSLIHYAPENVRWLGEQVHAQRVYESQGTFRWMKTSIRNRNPVIRRTNGLQLTYADAGRDFLSAVLTFAKAELNLGDEEIAFSVPVEAYEDYTDWLGSVAEQAALPRYRFIDEPSAAALGYGTHVQAGKVYCVFDFGGGTLDVAVVLIEDEAEAVTGRRCRVLGKAGVELGGSTIDHWLFHQVLEHNGRKDSDDEVRQLSTALLVECERAKEALSTRPSAEASVMNPETGSTLGATFTRGQFEELLERHQAFAEIQRAIRRALKESDQRGYTEDDINAVLMLGGSSLIPSVQKRVQEFFGTQRVKLDRPLDAVARGAAAFAAGVDFYDHIQHDYAIRHVSPNKGDYDFRVIVKRGTAYPTGEPLARLLIKGTYDNQSKLGIAIFELGDSLRGGTQAGQPVELVFDPSGAARVRHLTPDDAERRSRFWLNEHSPTFLTAEPPVKKGEERFQAEFTIDGNKHLLITARDLKTGRLLQKNYPVVKLT